MKMNLPVVDDEIRIPDDAVMVSRTDKKGRITYVSGYFAEISGYSLPELLGQSHNIVRHPDVPSAVFADMWDTLRRGECWRGTVKNRAKSGRYYWVDAWVSPIFEGSKIVGYSSIRRRASPEQIDAAMNMYAAANRGKSLRPWWRSHGFTRLISIRTGVTLGIITAMAACLVGTAYSVGKIRQYQEEYGRAHQVAVVGTERLARIKFLMAENRTLLLMALQQGPAAPPESRAVSAYIDAVSANRTEIGKLWQDFYGLPLQEPVRHLADEYWQARQRYVTEGLAPVQAALAGQADFRQAAQLIAGSLSGSYHQANALVDRLADSLQRSSEDAGKALVDRHDREVVTMFWAAAAAAMFFAICGILFFRGIMRPLQSSIDNLSAIARGDLSRHPDAIGQGETQALSQAVAITQCNLHSVLDEIAQNASVLTGVATRLNIQARHIADGTDEQHGRVHMMLDKMSDSAGAIQKISIQAEAMHGEAEGTLAVLGMAEKDMSDMLDRMRQSTQSMRTLFGHSIGLLENVKRDLDAPAATVLRDLDMIRPLLDEMSRMIEAEEPVLVGLDAIASGSWKALKDICDRLAELARELAIDTRLQAFAAEDIQRDIEIVTEFLVDNRQASHAIWNATRQVLAQASALEKLSSTFTFSQEPDL